MATIAKLIMKKENDDDGADDKDISVRESTNPERMEKVDGVVTTTRKIPRRAKPFYRSIRFGEQRDYTHSL